MKVLPIIAMLSVFSVPGTSAATPSSAIAVPAASPVLPSSISVQAEKLGASLQGEAVFRLSISNADAGAPAAFGFEYAVPGWPVPVGVVGSPLQIRSVELMGPGSLRPAQNGPVPKPVRRRSAACQREFPSPFSQAYWVELPANSSSVIELRARSTFPSWPATQYELGFSTFEVDDFTAQRTPLQTVGFSTLGPRGRRINMRVVKRRGAVHADRATPEIVGRTNPPLRKGLVYLQAVQRTLSGSVSLKQWSDPSPKAIHLGRVRTDQEGHFRFPSRAFPYVGEYAVIARSQAMGHIAADWNCGPFF